MHRGFTLIETIIVVVLTVVAFGVLANLFITFNSVHGYQRVVIDTNGSASASLNAIEAAVLSATRVVGSGTFGGTSYSTTASSIILELPAIDTAGVVLPSVYDTVVIFAEINATKNTLTEITFPGTGSARAARTRVLSSRLTSFSLTYDNADFTRVTNVVVDLTTRGTYKQEVVASHLHEQIYLRNHTPPL